MLNGKVALITGASSGIGAALARRLAREGAALVIAARRENLLRALADEISKEGRTVIPVAADVTVRDAAESLVAIAMEKLGRLDILVNNAGRGHFGSVEDSDDATIRSMFELNVYPLWYTTRPALAVMKKQRSGHIINIASMAGKIGYPFNSAYVAAKHACVGFTHALRMELMDTGIEATVVCPSGVRTDWAAVTEGGPMLSFFSASGPAIKRISAKTGIALPPVAGVMSPEDVAEKIVACIYHPVPELYTHEGSEEFVRAIALDRGKAERHMRPVVLGERAAYEELRRPK